MHAKTLGLGGGANGRLRFGHFFWGKHVIFPGYTYSGCSSKGLHVQSKELEMDLYRCLCRILAFGARRGAQSPVLSGLSDLSDLSDRVCDNLDGHHPHSGYEWGSTGDW